MNNWYKQHEPKPKLDFSQPIVIVRENITLLLLAPTIHERNYQWLNLVSGRLNSGNSWPTPQEAIESYGGDKPFNIDIDELIRNSDIQYTISK